MSDFSYLARYKDENRLLIQSEISANRIVFIGDSITEFWSMEYPEFFENSNYINRGIRGQTTPQILGRFEQDVIQLKPKSVHILAGTNDIAGNTGVMTLEMTQNNIQRMAEMALDNGIQVLYGSVLPACSYPWKPNSNPCEKIIELNTWIQHFAQINNGVYIDYHSALRDEKGCMKFEYSHDGVHPNKNGYACMTIIFNLVITQSEK